VWCSAVFVGVSTHQLVSPAAPVAAAVEEGEEVVVDAHEQQQVTYRIMNEFIFRAACWCACPVIQYTALELPGFKSVLGAVFRFGPPGSGSVIICTGPYPSNNKQKINRNLDFYNFIL
jgi:hypothetical protein